MIGFGRAVAKGTLFSLSNPEAALKIWYKANPDLKPAGTEAEVAKKIKDGLHILKTVNRSLGIDNRRVKKFGWVDRVDYEVIQDYFYSTGYLKNKLETKDLDRHFADKEFLEEVNNFDHQKIIDQAVNYKD
jgi:NitT/TauT family transport system substrate-binding protein